MFEIESKKPEEITITTKKTSVTFNMDKFTIDGNLEVGKIHGPGEFEIGDATIRGIAVPVVGSSSEDTADGKNVLENHVHIHILYHVPVSAPLYNGCHLNGAVWIPEFLLLHSSHQKLHWWQNCFLVL